MRVLVVGATGYVGSRLVPELLLRGHQVVASSSSEPDPHRFAWGGAVRWARADARDPARVRASLAEVDAVCYLVHSLTGRDFASADRAAAAVVGEAVREAGVPRTVYLSGLVPDVPRAELSQHLASRLEVEEILGRLAPGFCSLRAGIVVGAGSTSFEIIRQSAAVALVQVLPDWMTSLVQPIAVRDVVRLLAGAIENPQVTGQADVGGPDVLSYATLLGLYCDLAGLYRLQITAPAAPSTLTGRVAGAVAPLMCAAPWWTVAALVRSLQHDMVCHPEAATADLGPLLDGGPPLLPVADAIEQSLRPPGSPAEATTPGGDPQVLAGSDPAWVQPSGWQRLLPALPLGADGVLGGVAHVAEHRLRALTRHGLTGHRTPW